MSLKNEPVLIMVAVQAAIALVTAFGLHLDGAQTAAIMGFAAAVLGLIARQRVSPIVDPIADPEQNSAQGPAPAPAAPAAPAPGPISGGAAG